MRAYPARGASGKLSDVDASMQEAGCGYRASVPHDIGAGRPQPPASQSSAFQDQRARNARRKRRFPSLQDRQPAPWRPDIHSSPQQWSRRLDASMLSGDGVSMRGLRHTVSLRLVAPCLPHPRLIRVRCGRAARITRDMDASSPAIPLFVRVRDGRALPVLPLAAGRGSRCPHPGLLAPRYGGRDVFPRQQGADGASGWPPVPKRPHVPVVVCASQLSPGRLSCAAVLLRCAGCAMASLGDHEEPEVCATRPPKLWFEYGGLLGIPLLWTARGSVIGSAPPGEPKLR